MCSSVVGMTRLYGGMQALISAYEMKVDRVTA